MHAFVDQKLVNGFTSSSDHFKLNTDENEHPIICAFCITPCKANSFRHKNLNNSVLHIWNFQIIFASFQCKAEAGESSSGRCIKELPKERFIDEDDIFIEEEADSINKKPTPSIPLGFQFSFGNDKSVSDENEKVLHLLTFVNNLEVSLRESIKAGGVCLQPKAINIFLYKKPLDDFDNFDLDALHKSLNDIQLAKKQLLSLLTISGMSQKDGIDAEDIVVKMYQILFFVIY